MSLRQKRTPCTGSKLSGQNSEIERKQQLSLENIFSYQKNIWIKIFPPLKQNIFWKGEIKSILKQIIFEK